MRAYRLRFHRAWGTALFLLWWCPAMAAVTPTLEVNGDETVVTDNLKASLSLAGENCQANSSRRRIIQRQLRQQAGLAARAVGYYQARIDIDLQETDDCWHVALNVVSGPPVRVRDVSVSIEGMAASDPAFTSLIAETALQPGAILQHNHYQSLRDGLLGLCERHGYFDCRLRQHQLMVDPDRNQADILLELESGQRYVFGHFSLEQSVLRDSHARRFLRFQPGEPWNSEQLLETQQALLGSGYYTTARLERGNPEPGHDQVPGTLYLTARPKMAWLAGVGVSTDTGPRLRLGVENRYLNDRGHRWRADGEISPVNRSLSSSYEIPLRDPVRDRLVLSSAYRHEETDSAESEQIRSGASLISSLESGWVLTRSLDYERENFSVGRQTTTTELLIPGVQLQKIRSDHPVFPRRGWKLGTALRGTHPAISTTERFLQARLWAKGIVPLPRARLLARLEGGHTLVDDVTTLPASIRFFAGGDSSVRGFDYQALGPRAAADDGVGGRSLLVGSLEADLALTRPWHPALFVDGGNAFNDSGELNPRVSAGAGVRWLSPLGPIRIDLARAVDADRSWRLHLSMGPDL